MTPAHIRTLRVSVFPCEIGVGALSTSDCTLPTSYHHALHGGDAVRRSLLRLYGVSTLYFTSYFILPTSYFIIDLFDNRQGKKEGAPFPWCTLCANHAPMAFDDFFADCQPEATACL